MKKEKIVKPEMPVSPKSVDESKIIEIGKFWTYIESLKRLYSGFIISGGIAFIIVIIGLLIISESVGGGLFVCFLGIILGAILALVIKKKEKKPRDVSFEEIGQQKLNEYFDKLKTSPNRKIDTQFYSGYDGIKSLQLTPTVFVRGGKFEEIAGTDFLIDETNGKFAICSTFDEEVIRSCNIFDMDKVIGVNLTNNGQTIYETKKQNGLTRAAVGYVLAGGVGAVVGSNTATQKTTSQRIDDFIITITYNDLSRAYLVCNFGGDRVGADHLYQVFTVICKRNEA